MAERVVWDPVEVATARTEVDVTPWIAAAGIDWGDAAIEQYLAQAERGQLPVDFRVPNRTITVPLAIKHSPTATFDEARSVLQAKAALSQREGGWIKRVTRSGLTVFADVVNATLKLGGGWGQAHRDYDADAQLVLEAIPDFYGAEIALTDRSSGSAAELVFVETQIKGDCPGRCRLVIDEDSGNDQLGLLYALRHRHYSSAATAKPAYAATDMTPMDAAAAAAGAVTHAQLQTFWLPVLSTDLLSGGALTHTGSYRVWAEVSTGSGDVSSGETTPLLRLVYGVGDGRRSVENAPRVIPGTSDRYLIDLGTIRLDQAPVGTHSWRGVIQAMGSRAGQDVSVRRIWFENTDECSGVLRAEPKSVVGSVNLSARDDFESIGAAQGPRSPTAAATSFDSSADWSGPNNALASDNVHATVALTNAFSDYLQVTDFGFTIPSGEPIRGVTVEIERGASNAAPGIQDIHVLLVKGGTRQGVNKAKAGVRWPTTDAYAAYGGPVDTWGVSLTDTDVNASNFGVAIKVATGPPPGATASARVDHVRVTVAYGSGGTLDTRVAPLGGTWASTAQGGGGSATDFSGTGTGQIVRATTGDQQSGYLAGRVALLSATYSEIEVGGEFNFSAMPVLPGQFLPGVITRYIDANNFAQFRYIYSGGHKVQLFVVVGGIATQLGIKAIPALPNYWLWLKLQATAAGRLVATVGIRGSTTPLYTLAGVHPALATGGVLASGKSGIQDANLSSSPITRLYDNVHAIGAASGPAVPSDAVVFANRSLELRWDGAFRQGASGGGYQPAAPVLGDLLRIPSSGLEGRPVEFLLKASRGDLDELPNPSADAISARCYYRPSWLIVPGA